MSNDPTAVGFYTVLDDAPPGRFHTEKTKPTERPRGLPEPYRLTSLYGFSNVEVDDLALAYLALSNGQVLQKIKYLLRKNSGPVNSGFVPYTAKLVNGKIQFKFKGKDRPKFEYVVFGGAIVYVYATDGDKYFVKMQEVGKPMPDAPFFPPVQRMRQIDQFGNLATLPYNSVLFCRKGDSLWIDKSRLRKLS